MIPVSIVVRVSCFIIVGGVIIIIVIIIIIMEIALRIGMTLAMSPVSMFIIEVGMLVFLRVRT